MNQNSNLENHIEALDYSILIDRKKGECYELVYHRKGYFIASCTTKKKLAYISLDKICSGLSIRRYRILEVKN